MGQTTSLVDSGVGISRFRAIATLKFLPQMFKGRSLGGRNYISYVINAQCPKSSVFYSLTVPI
ncbi:MAG: hypothetical protein ACYTXC_17815 [Nostoc sp.]